MIDKSQILNVKLEPQPIGDMKLIDTTSAPTIGNTIVSGSGIDWQYFFGGSSGRSYDRYYKAEINGQRVEKHGSNRGTVYAIGNIDKAKKKYKSEAELLEACLPDR